MCVLYVSMHVQKCHGGHRQTPGTLLALTLLIPLRWGLSLNLELCWQPEAPAILPSPPPTELG